MMFNVSAHDSYPPQETALVDHGLGEANDAAAPLHEVRPLSCFARTEAGRVVGGAVGRWWGQCGKLQQLWVEASYCRRGIGTQLIQAFEARAREHGCSTFYLETFSFQSPRLYESLGYTVAYEHTVYPHGIVKYLMVKFARTNQNAPNLLLHPKCATAGFSVPALHLPTPKATCGVEPPATAG
jgi:GNAT superfamily N-acetyltransferase